MMMRDGANGANGANGVNGVNVPNGTNGTSHHAAPAERTHYVLQREFTGHKKSISAVKFSADGAAIATSSADKSVHLSLIHI